jgi:hypothetical protein
MALSASRYPDPQTLILRAQKSPGRPVRSGLFCVQSASSISGSESWYLIPVQVVI